MTSTSFSAGSTYSIRKTTEYLLFGVKYKFIQRCIAKANDSKEEFMKTTKNRSRTEKLVLTAMMTTLVIVFQALATYTTFFGPFSTAVGLIPIAIGACLCGPAIGAWLGLVFGIVVLVTGNAALFFAFSVPGTIITVLLKGAACGFAAGLVYKLLEKKLKFFAAVVAALVCPVVNTGIFLLGSAVFFMPYAEAIGELIGSPESGFGVFIALAFANFIIEVLMNALLSPIFVRILKIRKKAHN